jgi:hypothetical protein
MLNITVFLTISVYLLAIYFRRLKVGSNFTTDYFALFLLASLLYNCLGQLTIIKYDDLSQEENLLFSLFILLNSLVLLIAAFVFPKYVIWQSTPKTILPAKYMTIGLATLAVGYLFWYLNYARVGGILASIFETFNRSDRNAMLTEQRGNLPYVHFFFAANIFLYYANLVKTGSVYKSVKNTCLLLSPLLAFFLLEGERSSILKHIFVFWFVTAYYQQRSPNINYKLVSIFFFAIISFSLIGNLRQQIINFIVLGDPSSLINQFQTRGFGLIIPNEFAAILFTAKKYFSLLLQNKIEFEYGYTFWQGVPYLFPRSVYDIFGLVKASTVADNFGMYIANEIGNPRKMGFGMSIIGENIKNFGYFAILTQLLEVYLFYILLRLIAKFKGMQIVSISLIPCFFLINRVAFASMFSMIIWVSFISFFFILMYSPISYFFKTRHNPV